MKALNGSVKTTTPIAEDKAYQRVAHATDDGIDHVMRSALLVEGSTPGAVVAGAVMALVRFCLSTMETPKTVRNVLLLLMPSVNRAAEQLAGSAPDAGAG